MSSCSQFRYESKKWNIHGEVRENRLVENAKNKTVFEKTNDKLYQKRVYNINNILIEQRNYSDSISENPIGEATYWYDDGTLKKIVNYKTNCAYNGDIITYYQNGNIKRKDKYKDGELVSGECFTEDGKLTTHTPFFIEPTLDIKELLRHIKYPEIVRRADIQERVVIKFHLTKDNKISEYYYDSDNSIQLVNEALDAMLKHGITTVAKEDGEPVNCWLYVPVVFKFRD